VDGAKRRRVDMQRRRPTPDYTDPDDPDALNEYHRQYVFEGYMQEMNMVDHHVTNFDDLTGGWLKDIVMKYGNIDTEFKESHHSTRVSNYRFTAPSITPRDAHRFNSSYFGTITVDIEELHICKYQGDNGTLKPSGDLTFPWIRTQQTHHNTKLCDFPMMVRGDHNSQFPEWGGSFITSGKRRYIPLVKTLMTNFPFRFVDKLFYTAHVRSVHLDKQHRSTSSLNVQIRRFPGIRSIAFNNVHVILPYLKPPVPMMVLVMALGELSTKEFMQEVTNNVAWDVRACRKYLIMFENDHHGCNTQADALGFISKLYKRTDVMSDREQASRVNSLRNEVLPHLKDMASPCKSMYLAYLFRTVVLLREGVLKPTNRDSFVFTMITDAATSLAFLFRVLYIKFIEQCGKILRRGINQKGSVTIANVYNEGRLTKKIRSALATGQWSTKRVGVSHQLNSTNNNSILSQLRRVSSSYLNNDGKHIEPRMLKADSYGYTCAAETPDGESCGLVSSLACTSRVTRGSDPNVVMEILVHQFRKHGFMVDDDDKVQDDGVRYRIFDPFGRPAGFVTDPDKAVRTMVLLRRSMSFDHFVSYYRCKDTRELRVLCLIGRFVRPLIVLENVHKVADIMRGFRRGGASSLVGEMMIHGVVEYVSAAEETDIRVALSMKRADNCSHMELGDVSFVGIVAALAPFFRHNQGPRLVYWVGMTKQAIWHSRMPDIGSITKHHLWYGHKPLVATRTSHTLGMDQTAIGTNVLIAIYAHPYCQEDAVVVNKAVCDRGFAVSSVTHIQDTTIFRKRARSRKHDDQVRHSVVDEQFHQLKPENTLGLRIGSRHAIRRDGLCRPGDKLKATDICISKSAPLKRVSDRAKAIMPEEMRSTNHQQKRFDKSIHAVEDGRVSSVFHAQKPTGDIVKIETTSMRIPELGDKLSSEHSQKCVIGRVLPNEDMVFIASSGVPISILVNPEGFPSRMTVGMLISMLFGNAVLASGDLGVGIDDQLFDIPIHKRKKVIEQILLRNGCTPSCRVQLQCGITGAVINTTTYAGFISYSKLNHMVASKSYARSTGSINMINRQATLGRSNGGGIRFGNMESECVVSHAGAEMMRERMLTVADEFKVYICNDCGNLADGNNDVAMYLCRFCQTSNGVRSVSMPYTTKFMTQSLIACGIKPIIGLMDVG